MPDIERFMRTVDDAREVDKAMSANEGVIPAYALGWSVKKLEDISLTLADLSVIHGKLAEELKQFAETRHGQVFDEGES